MENARVNGRTQRMLVPQYVRRFACIGGACEDTCCAGWRVAVDQETYAKYRACPDPELLVQLQSNVTRNRKNPTPAAYAKIRLTDDAACPFLDAERLCAIQRRLGESYLSATCTSYPRVRNVVNGVSEESMTMACPEAARLALLDPGVMEFDDAELPASRAAGIHVVDTRPFAPSEPARHFWELRGFSIQVLQHRAYPVGDRLLLLGLFYRAVEELMEQGRVDELPRLMASYAANVEAGAYREPLEQLRPARFVPIALLRQIEDRRLLAGAVSPRYRECLRQFSAGIGNVPGAVIDDVTRAFTAACETYYEPFMKTHEHMLEHLLVNYVFRGLFPFSGPDANPFHNYVRLAVYYALIRTFLIGIAGYHRDAFGAEHVITLVQSFAKTIEHNPTYLAELHAALMANGSASMAHMTLLITSGASGR